MAEYYIGEIRVFAGNYAPDPNWLICDGRSLSVTDYQLLFALIGTTYGGDGTTTFNIPDLRGRLAVHRINGLPKTTQFGKGNSGGSEAVTLTTAQMPSHTHAFEASSAAATTTTPGSTVTLAASPAPWLQYLPSGTSVTTPAMASASVTVAGSSQPHPNVMPGNVINYIIATNGIYPTPAS